MSQRQILHNGKRYVRQPYARPISNTIVRILYASVWFMLRKIFNTACFLNELLLWKTFRGKTVLFLFGNGLPEFVILSFSVFELFAGFWIVQFFRYRQSRSALSDNSEIAKMRTMNYYPWTWSNSLVAISIRWLTARSDPHDTSYLWNYW